MREMAGGGNRRDDGSLVINSTNVFAALGSLRKKKKSEKESSSSSRSKGASKKAESTEQPQVFWAPTPLTVKSWADVDDEDDDDYYATTAPPQSGWGPADPPKAKESVTPVEVWRFSTIVFQLVCFLFIYLLDSAFLPWIKDWLLLLSFIFE